MALYWKELLPADSFTIRIKQENKEHSSKVITSLYQPLIGIYAASLYQVLTNRLEKDSYICEETSHRDLMAQMQLPLHHIVEARKKLEGIGLLKVLKKEETDTPGFIYEIQPPLSPEEFFRDDVLSVFLFNRLGREKYRQIRERFIIPALDTSAYKDVTSSFDQVFTSLHQSEMKMTEEIFSENSRMDFLSAEGGQGIEIKAQSFDIDLLYADLPAFINKEKIKSSENIHAIKRLAFLYRMEPLDMSKEIQRSLDQNEELDLSTLRKKVQEWYRYEYGSEPPALGYRTQPEEYRQMKDQVPVTGKEKMIKYFEEISPMALLESVSEGAKVPAGDVKIAESLLFEYKLQPGVANVLIDYVLRINNMKLNSAFVQKIAGQWTRAKVTTVKEAMELANKENKAQKERKDHAPNKEYGSRFGRSSAPKPGTVPKWLEEQKAGHVSKVEQTPEEVSKWEEEKQLFKERLKKWKEKSES